MYITINGYDEFTLYVRSNAETNYDYLMVSNLNKTIEHSTTSTDLIKATTKGNQQSSTSIGAYTKVTFTNILAEHGSGEHHFMVLFRKDGTQNSGTDCGYVIIPNGNNN